MLDSETTTTYCITNCTDYNDSDMTVEDWSRLQWQMMCRCEGAGHEMTPDPISVLIMASCNLRPALCQYICQSVEDGTRGNKDIAIELIKVHVYLYETRKAQMSM